MSAQPDRIALDLNLHDSELQAATDFWNTHEAEAIRDLREQLLHHGENLREPCLDTALEWLLDDITDNLAEDWYAFRTAIGDGNGRDDAELGRLLRRALERAADRYIASDKGQAWIANRIYALKQEHDAGYSE